MKTSGTTWIQITATLVLGLVIGGYSAFRFTSYFFLDGHYASLVAELTTDISTLKRLREKDVKTAMDQLEGRIDVYVLSLDVPQKEMSKTTYSSVLDVLKTVDKYRKEYSVKSHREETNRMVADILLRAEKQSASK